MVSAEELAARRTAIAASPDLSGLLERLAERARPVLEREPVIPSAKALLSVDGGFCPRDGTQLTFDPWSPVSHRCPRCGVAHQGERHDRWWARFQHLWLGERTAHLAALGALGGDAAAAARAKALLLHYGEHYFQYPNKNNVLGPSRLFFSTYLESIWLTNYLAAAILLRESGQLDDDTAGAVSSLGEEAANLIGEFDEGLSNRQTWHNAALSALAVWFEDEELLRRTVEGPSGLLAHLLRGFGGDGMWFEGENYHLFALRGLLLGLGWVRSAGVDPLEEPKLAGHLDAALRAPTLTALPDLTFPARKDSRFGASLAQPMYLELWEAGVQEEGELDDWLAALYGAPAPPAQVFDSYLHEAGEPAPSRRGRVDLSWWMLLAMPPSRAGDAAGWRPGSALLEAQGLAVLRSGSRYASLECGANAGGHSHPDRLHLTVHDRGVHWLPDFGTGSYVSRDLFWYRSTLAHNAPLLDGISQPPGDAVCEYFDAKGAWGWVRAHFGPVTRTLVAAPQYLLDMVELSSDMDRRLDLPWHLTGQLDIRASGQWRPAELADEFATDVQALAIEGHTPLTVTARGGAGQIMTLVTRGATRMVRAVAPGPPGAGPAPFVVLGADGRAARIISALSAEPVRLELDGEVIIVTSGAASDRHQSLLDGWQVGRAEGEIRLSGRRPAPRSFAPLISREVPFRQTGIAPGVNPPPALDGTLDGFDLSQPLALDHEDQYRRSEEPYSGPEDFAAVAYVNWDDEALYLAVEVSKPEIVLRAEEAPPLLLDNEPDDIHSDGIQVYIRPEPEGAVFGFLVVPQPDENGVRARVAGGCAGEPEMVTGAWTTADVGYSVTLALSLPGWEGRQSGDRIAFDLLVNEMLPDRERRSGQLVWSGGSGWVWLRGDRQDPERFGELELA